MLKAEREGDGTSIAGCVGGQSVVTEPGESPREAKPQSTVVPSAQAPSTVPSTTKGFESSTGSKLDGKDKEETTASDDKATESSGTNKRVRLKDSACETTRPSIALLVATTSDSKSQDSMDLPVQALSAQPNVAPIAATMPDTGKPKQETSTLDLGQSSSRAIPVAPLATLTTSHPEKSLLALSAPILAPCQPTSNKLVRQKK